MLDALSPEERLLLLKYLCAFAWTDLVVNEAERRFVRRILNLADLGPSESKQVEEWLDVAPSPGSVNASDIPAAHRRTFVDAARALMYADGAVDPEERQSLEKLRAALGER
jgi:uncharacterized tellurite resistance protein B-like protein